MDWSLGDVFLSMMFFFLWFLYIWMFIAVFSDIFRRRDTGGLGEGGVDAVRHRSADTRDLDLYGDAAEADGRGDPRDAAGLRGPGSRALAGR